ncbi:hypothetical protein K461DRAFT_270552 [Myriangium duriaei CBS 260.36]|uniref:Histone H1 n=1 Tax=Myriangium duriaei CBS 260.36 TaxID=1168546 RepID=A0A9P4IU36_9PEZI|nr:hypothetical protein K461DRAFT_270552 [Myriangium duriaei CBS 260.36]
MAPKAASKAAASKKSAPAAHGTYQDMIKDAIIQLKERNGSSRQTLKKYVLANNQLGSISDATFTTRFNSALAKGSETGIFARPKGPSGPVKLAKPAAGKPAKASSPAATKPAAKATKAKATTTKAKTTKAAAPKKAAATKKTETKTAAPKKAAAKANTGKSRKTAAAAAPAVGDEKPAVALGKTKSGRVTKSKAPAATATKKKAPAKKAAPKKEKAAKEEKA